MNGRAPKVLLVGDYPPPAGGIAIHVQQLQRFLEGRGVEVRVLDIGKGEGTAPGVFKARGAPDYLLHVGRYAASGWIVHLHTSGNNPKSWMLIASARLPLGTSARRVVTLHSGLLPEFLDGALARPWLARRALSGYGRVVAVSETIRAALASAGVPAVKLAVQPAFCASQVLPGAAPPAFFHARARRKPLVAYAYHPSPVYGCDVMFAALKQLARRFPDVGLAVFGPGSTGEELARAAREARVEGLLEIYGELEHAAALAVISGCDALARPTTADGDAISVREALALGTPAVASDAAARPAGTRTYPKRDPSALADALTQAVLAGRIQAPTVDAGPELLKLYEQMWEGEAIGDASNGGSAPAAQGMGPGGLLERLGRRSAVQDAHHADPLAGQPDSLG